MRPDTGLYSRFRNRHWQRAQAGTTKIFLAALMFIRLLPPAFQSLRRRPTSRGGASYTRRLISLFPYPILPGGAVASVPPRHRKTYIAPRPSTYIAPSSSGSGQFRFTPFPIPTVNGNTVRSFPTHGQKFAAQPPSHALTSE